MEIGKAIAHWPILRDARLFQIAFLATLLTIGVLLRDFALLPAQMALAFAAGLATQALWIGALGIRHRGVLSAVITCFGLSILLRADSLWVHPLAAALAISAKFVIRVRGKHLYNPANLGVILAISLLPGAWISAGQWGQTLALAVWFVVLGGVVVNRAQRADIAWVFLAAYLGLIALRVSALGQPWTIFLHQLSNGGLLLFAFFMISDPMTIPNRRDARVAYAVVVALVAFLWHFALFKPNGLVWALFFCTPLVPIMDRLWPAEKFEWKAREANAGATPARARG
ncbi:MAG TPA: RnfABCDGE type electron transport complex subunit D [Casimicrobiaceae bacterium]|nr:RnfABCDGE type electron transport complex subunit D [Casimicrobiaceae bacterium]